MTLLAAHHLTIAIGKHIICRDLQLTIRAGEQWGILGANGAGKTTLLHTLAGLHPFPAGDILLQGQSLATLTAKQRAQKIALLFQDQSFIFPQTVWEYCLDARYPYRTPFHATHDRDHAIVTQALTTMDLMPLAQRNILQLSGGEKRRLAIAAVLAQTPQLYLLDEPVNHLDVRRQIQVLTFFKQQIQTTACASIITLHDMNLAQQFCTHVLLMYADGHTQQGPASEILTTAHLSELYDHPITATQSPLFWPTVML